MKTKNSNFDIQDSLNRYRIEIYVPVLLPHTRRYRLYHRLRLSLERHLSMVFGGATSLEGMGLWYDQEERQFHPDRVAVIYTDTGRIEEHVKKYISSLLAILARKLLEEGEILVAYYPVKHAKLTRKGTASSGAVSG